MRAANRLVNNLKICSGKKPARAPAVSVTFLWKKRNEQKIGKNRKTPDAEQRLTKEFYPRIHREKDPAVESTLYLISAGQVTNVS